MIYVATVHVFGRRWADIQATYLERTMDEPYQVFASFQGMQPVQPPGFTHVFEHHGMHAGKLNLLAAEIAHVADPDDLIMFLDGDAFPISDPMPMVREHLARTPVVAIKRVENAGDQQPHPAFCVMAVRTWQQLGGDWSSGYRWRNVEGNLTSDVGGNLMRLLELHGLEWTPLTRSNTVDLHPLWFGIYGEAIYHHGAGFRPALSRHDLLAQPKPWRTTRLPVVRSAITAANRRRDARWQEQLYARGRELSEGMIAEIKADPQFYRRFLGGTGSS
jgi:hypothetical protein